MKKLKGETPMSAKKVVLFLVVVLVLSVCRAPLHMRVNTPEILEITQRVDETYTDYLYRFTEEKGKLDRKGYKIIELKFVKLADGRLYAYVVYQRR